MGFKHDKEMWDKIEFIFGDGTRNNMGIEKKKNKNNNKNKNKNKGLQNQES